MKGCLHCGKEIESRRKKFCNHSCANSYNNKGVRRHSGERKKCLNCGKGLKHRGMTYCSFACNSEYEWKVWCMDADKYDYFVGMDSTCVGNKARKPKRYTLEKQNGKCSICGINEWMGKPVPFVLDHIDGDASNWKKSNIRVIRRNCDGQLPTYCGKNRGNGKRKMMYVDKI